MRPMTAAMLTLDTTTLMWVPWLHVLNTQANSTEWLSTDRRRRRRLLHALTPIHCRALSAPNLSGPSGHAYQQEVLDHPFGP